MIALVDFKLLLEAKIQNGGIDFKPLLILIKCLFFWPPGCEIIENIVNFYIHSLFKALKRPNSQCTHKKISKSYNINMNNLNFHLLAPSYLKNRGGSQNGHKSTLASKIPMANILIREK